MSINIRIQPAGKYLSVEPGQTVLEVLNKVGIQVSSSCGGRGTCGKCRVKVTGSLSEPGSDELGLLSQQHLEAGYRLACRVLLIGDATIDVTETGKGTILETAMLPRFEFKPDIRKVSIKVPFPSSSSEDDYSRLMSSLNDALGKAGPGGEFSNKKRNDSRKRPHRTAWAIKTTCPDGFAGFVKDLPFLLRSHDGAVTAIIHDRQVISLEPGDSTLDVYGVAVDIGTTTMVGYLWNLSAVSDGDCVRQHSLATRDRTSPPPLAVVDIDEQHSLAAGERTRAIAVSSCYNPQAVRGDDIISRITYSSESPDNLRELQSLVIGGLNSIILDLTQKASINPEHVYRIVLVGNTVMHHLALGITPKYLGLAPYAPAVKSGMTVKASELGIRCNPDAMVSILPNIGGFIGSDILAGLIAAGISKPSGVYLLLDLGTNGEMVLCNGAKALACSTAAGPAFEGARISMGMRATDGAVSHVFLNRDLIEYETVGGSRPRGICGSGLVDAISVMLTLGIIGPSGRLLAPAQIPSQFRDRILDDEDGQSFVLIESSETANGEPIRITQKDIREVQLAKGAIAAGMMVLMRRLGVEDKDIDGLFIAGAFGNYIDPKSAQNIGLIPPVDLRRIKPLGNAAGTGAQLSLLSKRFYAKSLRLVKHIEAIDLAAEPEFSQVFVDSMCFTRTPAATVTG